MAASSGLANAPGAPAAPPGLGKLVRLRPKAPSELPSHPSFTSLDTDIAKYAADVLAEAEAFMTAYLPTTFKEPRDKPSPPSTASVALQSHEINSKDIPSEVRTAGGGAVAENWFARTSVHENAAKEGTMSWEECDLGLRKDHSVHEMEYTPDVKDAHLALDWSSEFEKSGRRIDGGWEDVQAGVWEMLHHIPPPLNQRVFSVLVITAKRSQPTKEFMVVQIPVTTKGLPLEAEGHSPGVKYYDVPKVTAGKYVSIEKGEVLEEGKNVKWQMATASDAGGNLPMWAQKMGVPGAVVKDVGLFIDWIAKRRQGKA